MTNQGFGVLWPQVVAVARKRCRELAPRRPECREDWNQEAALRVATCSSDLDVSTLQHEAVKAVQAAYMREWRRIGHEAEMLETVEAWAPRSST